MLMKLSSLTFSRSLLMPCPTFFVTATGTDVGKTIVSAAILSAAARKGLELAYWKPVQTGGSEVDQQTARSLCPAIKLSKLKSWSYDLAASPDQAALAAEAPEVSIEDLRHVWNENPSNPLLIEGAGGLLVPLNQHNETWRDFLSNTAMPVVLVVASGLGTLNHSSLTLEALDQAGIQVLAVVVNGPAHPANLSSLRRMHPHHHFVEFPWIELQSESPEWIAASNLLLETIMARHVELKTGPADWLTADRLHCWHPYTQHKTAPDPVPIVRAHGIYLHTADGEKLIDASASWWTNSLGHAHPSIGAALRKQHQRIDHCIFGGATHEPASILAKRLAALSEQQLPRIFYSDNGSCSVEVGLKMAAQTWSNQGIETRKKFLFFRGAYHGDTFGAMSVAATEGFHKAFSPYLFAGHSLTPVTAHSSRLCPEGPQALSQGLRELDELFAQFGAELAGVIIEPLVQGASGMNIQELAWLQAVDKHCKRQNVPLILDEVFTGMGRVGSYFAWQRAGISPDIVCIAKGLTGGTMPLAVTMTSSKIYDCFLDADGSKALLHGHTFTGHALACAAALATLDCYVDEDILPRVNATEQMFQEWIDAKARRLGLVAPRCMGAILAFELPGSGPGDYFHPLAQRVPKIARQNGLLMRTLGNTMYFVPPLVIKPRELRDALGRIEATIGALE
jgi:adenosylmethionine---8-amino-7-oxononanoate aminotransferase